MEYAFLLFACYHLACLPVSGKGDSLDECQQRIEQVAKEMPERLEAVFGYAPKGEVEVYGRCFPISNSQPIETTEI